MIKMNKVTVTELQMNAIKRLRDDIGKSLENVIAYARGNNFCGSSELINLMSTEQIVLAWHGHVEVEKEYVSFDEAMKALKDEKNTVHFHFADDVIEIWNERQVNDSMQNNSSVEIYWRDLVNGKWSIKGDNL